MELLELFTRAIGPQLLARIFDNIPQYIIFFGFIAFFIFKYLLKWNKARVEKIKAKEARSNEIWEDGKTIREDVKLIREESKIIREERKQDRIESAKQFKEIVENFDKKFELTNDKIGALNTRVVVIETENRINSKQESAMIGTLNYIKNSIDTNKNK